MQENPPEEFQKIADDVSVLEQNILALGKKQFPWSENYKKTLEQLKVLYVKIIFDFYDWAHKRDLEQNLWKTVFYKTIESYRRQLRKCSQNSENPKSLIKFQQVSGQFKKFLTNSNKFYTHLVTKFQTLFELELHTKQYSYVDQTSHPSYQSVHKCYIFLGDLNRYHRDMGNCTNWEQNSMDAQSYYKKAILLVPDNGNPHNQLAVLSTYQNDKLNAAYRYFRSLAVELPFPTAKENLKVLFDKNKKILETTIILPDLQSFSTLFVELQSIILMNNFAEFDSLAEKILDAFQNLLSETTLSENDIVQLVTGIIFSLHYVGLLTTKECIIQSIDGENKDQMKILKFLFDMISKIIMDSKFWAPVCIFTDWLFVSQVLNEPFQNQDSEELRMKFWEVLAKLFDTLDVVSDFFEKFKNRVFSVMFEKNPKFVDQERHPLPEELELIGFLPLKGYLTKNIQFYNDRTTKPENLANIRCEKLASFAQSCIRKGFIDINKEKHFFVTDQNSSNSVDLGNSYETVDLSKVVSPISSPAEPFEEEILFHGTSLLLENQDIIDQTSSQSSQTTQSPIKILKKDNIPKSGIIEKPFQIPSASIDMPFQLTSSRESVFSNFGSTRFDQSFSFESPFSSPMQITKSELPSEPEAGKQITSEISIPFIPLTDSPILNLNALHGLSPEKESISNHSLFSPAFSHEIINAPFPESSGPLSWLQSLDKQKNVA